MATDSKGVVDRRAVLGGAVLGAGALTANLAAGSANAEDSPGTCT